MDTIPVIYENGVFRPTVPVVLPEATKGEVMVPTEPEVIGCNSPELYAIMRRNYDTGEHDLAARVDEIDP
jgi:predicted DNA-binding antitoxin AbrB/MazE fold protein